ncbi:TRAP transporter small permease [Chloroflexota bacterium]
MPAAFDMVLSGTGYFAGMVCAVMALIVSYEAVMRYFFNRPTRWVTDVSTLGLLFITLLGAAWVLRREGHVSIDFLTMRLGTTARGALATLVSLLSLLACALLLWQGAQATWEAYQNSETLHRFLIIPKHLVLWVFPFGALLLCIQFARRTRAHMRTFVTSRRKVR